MPSWPYGWVIEWLIFVQKLGGWNSSPNICLYVGFSIHIVYSVIRVQSELCVQEVDTTFIVWTLHNELYVDIHIINMIEKDVHLVFLVMQITSSTYLLHQVVGMGHCGPSASSSKYLM